MAQMAKAVLTEKARQGGASSRPLFGFDFENEGDLSAIVERVLGPQPADNRLPFVVTPNVDYIVRLRESIDAGGTELPVDEKRLTRARRAVEKAAAILREPDDAD